MPTKNISLKQLALSGALGTLAFAATTAFAHDAGKGYDKQQSKADRDYRKAVSKADKAEHKAYRNCLKGRNIPREYVDDRYYVRDYRAYHLAQPPSGYMWVRPHPDDDTYYTVPLASGLISQILGR